jgi:hypothetical protein
MIQRIKAWLTLYQSRKRTRRLRRQWRASGVAPRLMLLPLHLLLQLQLRYLEGYAADGPAKTASFMDRLRRLLPTAKKTGCESSGSATPNSPPASRPPCLVPWQVNLLRRLALYLLTQVFKALRLYLGMRKCSRRYSSNSCRPSRTSPSSK